MQTRLVFLVCCLPPRQRKTAASRLQANGKSADIVNNIMELVATQTGSTPADDAQDVQAGSDEAPADCTDSAADLGIAAT